MTYNDRQEILCQSCTDTALQDAEDGSRGGRLDVAGRGDHNSTAGRKERQVGCGGNVFRISPRNFRFYYERHACSFYGEFCPQNALKKEIVCLSFATLSYNYTVGRALNA